MISTRSLQALSMWILQHERGYVGVWDLPSGQKCIAHNLHGPYFLPVDRTHIYVGKAENMN